MDSPMFVWELTRDWTLCRAQNLQKTYYVQMTTLKKWIVAHLDASPKGLVIDNRPYIVHIDDQVTDHQ
jgi:hypothetical protein